MTQNTEYTVVIHYRPELPGGGRGPIEKYRETAPSYLAAMRLAREEVQWEGTHCAEVLNPDGEHCRFFWPGID